jgi:hypothetical protein
MKYLYDIMDIPHERGLLLRISRSVVNLLYLAFI